MRRSFVFITIASAMLAAFLGLARYEARYFTRMAAADLVAGRMPSDHLAESIDDIHAASSLDGLARRADIANPYVELAIVEMDAAGVFSSQPEATEVSLRYQELLKKYPQSPLVHYRYGAYLLSRLQDMARRNTASRFLPRSGDSPQLSQAEEIAIEARQELAKVMQLDPHNSLPHYETAYSYLVFGRQDKAVESFLRGIDAPEFDSGDDVVITGAANAARSAGLPNLEGLAAVYKVAQYQPSYLSTRMEQLVIEILSDRAIRAQEFTESSYQDYLAGVEDLSEKLFQTAAVLRQSQASFVTSGLLWRKMMSESALTRDEALYAVARRQLVAASYRYVLVGWRRAGAGLMPQQSIIELDTPVDMRLPFSATAQRFTRGFFAATIVILIPAFILGLGAIRAKRLRQPALALLVLAVYAALGYAGSFYSVVRERGRTTDALERRLFLIRQAPQDLREEGQPSNPGEYRTDIPKEMLYTYDYTFQAGRVLAYIGTRDCYDALVESLADPALPRPVDVIRILEEATGERFGYKADGSKADNLDAVYAWQKWWREHRDSYPEAAAGTPTTPSRRGA